MEAVKKRVAAATVRFNRRGGQGVLVPVSDRLGGGLILTAAHVIHWTHTGMMTLGDDAEFIQEIAVAGGGKAARDLWPRGRRLLVYPLAVEPVADLAVLGAPDGQWMPEACAAFEQFCETTGAVALATAEFSFNKPIPAHVFTHTGRWISGRVKQMAPDAPRLVLETDEPIKGGTSGSPVVTADGLLLGVASSGNREALIPRPHLTAPAWLARQMVEDPAAEAERLQARQDYFRVAAKRRITKAKSLTRGKGR
jgi:Trypsin-like peptidase domain